MLSDNRDPKLVGFEAQLVKGLRYYVAMEQQNDSVVNNMDGTNKLETKTEALSKKLGCFTWWQEDNMLESLLGMYMQICSR
jgi:hypothetical protein